MPKISGWSRKQEIEEGEIKRCWISDDNKYQCLVKEEDGHVLIKFRDNREEYVVNPYIENVEDAKDRAVKYLKNGIREVLDKKRNLENEIRETAISIIQDRNLEGQCSFIAQDVMNELTERGIPSQFTRGNIEKDGFKAKHFWLEIPMNLFRKNTDGYAVIDPTVQQFDSQNMAQGINLGNVPEIAVLFPQDRLYNNYQRF